MFYQLGSTIYINEVFYIHCPNCDSYIDMCDKGIWHNADYMCNECLKYYTVKLGIEVTKCEK